MKKKILIVEDEAIIARGLKLCLTECGYRVLKIVSAGEDALRSVEKNNPDLILMDVRLRGSMDGYQTMAGIRLLSRAPVIYSTGGDPYEVNEKASDTKPYDYVIKPFNIRLLEKKIEKLLAEQVTGGNADGRNGKIIVPKAEEAGKE